MRLAGEHEGPRAARSGARAFNNDECASRMYDKDEKGSGRSFLSSANQREVSFDNSRKIAKLFSRRPISARYSKKK
jgi:hypothetical protein